MQLSIDRVQGTKARRSVGSAYAGIVFAVATADDMRGDFEAQALQCFQKLDRILAELGTDRANVLSATVYLADHDMKSRFDPIWFDWVGTDDPAFWPQRCLVGATLGPQTLVEIAITAARAT